MSDQLPRQGSIRKLWPTETEKFRGHLLRLDKESRRLRFAHAVSDAFNQMLSAIGTASVILFFSSFLSGVSDVLGIFLTAITGQVIGVDGGLATLRSRG